MLRRIIISLLIAAGIVFCCLLIFDFVARKTIEARLTNSLGLKIRIASYSFAPLRQMVTIKNFTIENPPGFSGKTLCSLKSGAITLDLSTWSHEIVSIKAIKLRGISINAEHGKNGFNLDYLKKGALLASRHKNKKPLDDRDENESSDKKEPAKKRRFKVGSLKIKKIEVRFKSPTMGVNSIHFNLPDVVIDQVSGPEDEGLTIDEILYKVLTIIIDQVSAQGPENYQDTIHKFMMDQLQNFYKK